MIQICKNYSNSSLGLPVCRIMCCMTNRETSGWCGTQVVKTLSPTDFLNVICLRERTSENPFDSSIFTTLLCGRGRSFPIENTFRNIDWYIGERNRHYGFYVGLDSVGIAEVLVNQVSHVFLDLMLGLSLRSYIKRGTGSNEPLAFLTDKYGKRNLNIFHTTHNSDYKEESILSCDETIR